MDKQTLRQYVAIAKEIDRLVDERQHIIARLQSPPQPDGMPRGGSVSDPAGNAATKLAMLAAMVDNKLDKLIDLRQDIEAAIEPLPANDRLLMRLRYIEGKRWEEIAVELNYNYRWVTKLHGRILEKVK